MFCCNLFFFSRDLDQDALESINREIEMLDIANGHPNIVRLLDVFIDTHYIFLVMERLTGPTLFELMKSDDKRLKDEMLTKWMGQVSDALATVHLQLQSVHRDINPRNIMFTDESLSDLKVIDFGSTSACTTAH